MARGATGKTGLGETWRCFQHSSCAAQGSGRAQALQMCQKLLPKGFPMSLRALKWPSGVSPSVTLEMLSLPPPLEFSTFPSWAFTRPEAPESSQQSRMLCLGSCCASGVYLDVVRRIVITFLRGKPSQILNAQELGPLHNCWVHTDPGSESTSPPVPSCPPSSAQKGQGSTGLASAMLALELLLLLLCCFFFLSRKRRGIGDYCACI